VTSGGNNFTDFYSLPPPLISMKHRASLPLPYDWRPCLCRQLSSGDVCMT